MSWGYKGHRAVATIAQKHFTSNTAYVVSAYLKGESMTDVSTWADENKNRTTLPRHFLNCRQVEKNDQFEAEILTIKHRVNVLFTKFTFLFTIQIPRTEIFRSNFAEPNLIRIIEKKKL
jgi:hypothetical protein